MTIREFYLRRKLRQALAQQQTDHICMVAYQAKVKQMKDQSYRPEPGQRHVPYSELRKWELLSHHAERDYNRSTNEVLKLEQELDMIQFRREVNQQQHRHRTTNPKEGDDGKSEA